MASIIANPRQRGNPALAHIKRVPVEFGDIWPDFVVGKRTAVLFLSLQYHRFRPEYLPSRLEQIQRQFRLGVLLCLVDLQDYHKQLLEVEKSAFGTGLSLVLVWSYEDAAFVLETLKSCEAKPAELIQGKPEADHLGRLVDALSSIPLVNRTDAVALLAAFGSLEGIIQASKEDLLRCPGIGARKVRQLIKTLHCEFFAS